MEALFLFSGLLAILIAENQVNSLSGIYAKINPETVKAKELAQKIIAAKQKVHKAQQAIGLSQMLEKNESKNSVN